MSTKHSKWIFDPILKGDGTFGGSYIVSVNAPMRGDKTWPIAEVYMETNAALIASAPDLLAERDRLREVNAELLAALEEAADLLNAVADSGGNVGDYGRDCFDALEAARAAIAKAEGVQS